MATATYDLLYERTTTSGITNAYINSIDQNYTHLILIVSAKRSSGATNGYISFNSDTSSSYYQSVMAAGDNLSKNAGSFGPWTEMRLDYNGSIYDRNNLFRVVIYDYTQTSTMQSFDVQVVGCQSSQDFAEFNVGRYDEFAAISSIRLRFDATINSGATIRLFGVL